VIPDKDSAIYVGAGDFTFPLIFVVSVSRFDYYLGFTVIIGATLGFALLQYFAAISARTKKTGLPGLPFICFSALVFYALGKFF
jgi:presenilin-like A22 family membrane protease